VSKFIKNQPAVMLFFRGRKTGERAMDALVKGAWVIRGILYMKNCINTFMQVSTCIIFY
jgi:hypothetical protein